MAGMSKEQSISVREIDNGYVIRRTTYDSKTGNATSSETYSKSCPEIQEARVGRDGNGAGSLKDAVEYLKR